MSILNPFASPPRRSCSTAIGGCRQLEFWMQPNGADPPLLPFSLKTGCFYKKLEIVPQIFRIRVTTFRAVMRQSRISKSKKATGGL